MENILTSNFADAYRSGAGEGGYPLGNMLAVRVNSDGDVEVEQGSGSLITYVIIK